jgi:VanZ family protein
LQDKFYHFLVYAVFGFLVARSFFSLQFSDNFHKYYLVFAILFSAIYGLSDEIHQSYVPGRFSSIGDFIADSSGSVIGVLIFHYRQGIKLFLTKYMPLKK